MFSWDKFYNKIMLLPHDPILSILEFFEKSSRRLKATFTSAFHLTLAHSFLFGANRNRIFAIGRLVILAIDIHLAA